MAKTSNNKLYLTKFKCTRGNLEYRTSNQTIWWVAKRLWELQDKAKCYYVYVQRSRTGALTSSKVRLKQYLSITYANPEPMLSMTIVRTINCNGVMLISTLNNKKFRDWRALSSTDWLLEEYRNAYYMEKGGISRRNLSWKLLLLQKIRSSVTVVKS